jgi:hypothetical protein
MPIQQANTDPNASTRALAVTPSDSADLAFTTKGVFVIGAGNLKVTMAEDTVPVVFTGVPAKTYLPISVSRIWATLTTATGIMALWE